MLIRTWFAMGLWYAYQTNNVIAVGAVALPAGTFQAHIFDGIKNYPTVTKDSSKIQSTTKVQLNRKTGMGR
jgi:hypothetical protein